jgi:hypothetical protein
MAKLTKAQRRCIQSAIDSLDRALTFIERDRTAICITGEINSAVAHTGDGSPGHEYRAAAPYRTQDYTGRDDSAWSIDWVRTLTPIDKGIGSDLVSFYTARSTLQALLSES